MEKCNSFIKCNAPLCPLDSGIKDRIWYADEDVCCSSRHGGHRWIRKQRSIQRLQTKSWLGKPITYEMLFKASRKRNVDVEKLRALAKRNLMVPRSTD